MEASYTNRAKITDTYNGIEIAVPAQRSADAFLTPAALLVLVAVGAYFIFFSKYAQSLTRYDEIAIGALCAVLAVGWLCSVYQFWWTLKGSEVVTIADGVLTIEKKHTLEKTVSYDLASAGSFRSVVDVWATARGQQWYNGQPWQIAIHGTVKFDYGVDTIQFGDWLSQAEGEYIIQKLKEKKLIG